MSRTCVIACIAVQCIAAMKEEGSQSLFQVFDEKYHQNWTLPTSNDLLDASGIDTSILYHPPPSVPASPTDQSPAPVPSPGPVPATQPVPANGPVPAIVPDSNASLSNSSSSDPSSLSASPQPEFVRTLLVNLTQCLPCTSTCRMDGHAWYTSISLKSSLWYLARSPLIRIRIIQSRD